MGNLSDDVIEWNGVWLKQIPYEEAFRIRCDVQLYARHIHQLDTEIYRDNVGPEDYRKRLERGPNSLANRSDEWWWVDYMWYIEVIDPTKEEYVSDGGENG